MKPLLKKILRPLLAVSLAVSGVAVIATAVAAQKEEATKAEAYYTPPTHYEVSDTAAELTSYYSSISSSATGTTLLSQLQSLNSTKRKKTMGYGTMGTSISNSPYIYTDYELGSSSKDSNGQVYGTKVASFYTKTSATSWNREHMWPNSRGGSAVEGDILHTRPTISSENSSRGNSFYVEGMNNSSAGWDPKTAGYEEWVRGECARVILYCVVANSSFSLSDASSISSGQTGYTSTMGDMDTLIKWHFAYTPNEYEINRNNGAEYLQGNRNPFVDHPEYVSKIWSNFNSNISNICSTNSSTYSNWVPGTASTYGTNSGATVTAPTSLTMNKSSASLSYTQTVQLSVTASPSGAANSVTWSSSNTNIASVDANGLVTAGSTAGTATITATSTVATSIKATCTITVTQPSNVALTSISASASSSSISIGKTATISVTNTPSNAYPTPTYTFTSSNTSKATVSDAGLVTAKAAGSVTITVKAFQNNTQKASTTVALTITEGSSDFEKVTSSSDLTNGEYLIVYEGGNVAFNGGLTTLDAASNTITVSPSNGTIEANTTTEAATFTISSMSGGYSILSKSGSYIYGTSGSNELKTSSSEQANSISISDGNADIVSNTSHLRYNDASGQLRFRYFKSSSYSNMKAVQLYKLGSGSSSSSATVSLDKSTLSLVAGNTGTLTATTTGTGTLTWSSNNTSVATVSNGTVTAKAAGTAVITASYGGAEATCTVTVTAAKTVSSLTVSGSLTNSTQYVGDEFDPTGLTVTAHYSDSTTANVTSSVTWTPDPLTASTTSVTGTYSGVSVTVNVTVVEPTLSSISTSGQTTSFYKGSTFSYGGTCTATYNNGSTKTVTPSVNSSSVNMNVAGNYTVTLSYTENGVTKTTTYTVTVLNTALTNSIQECYGKTNNTSVSDVYGLYVGSGDGHNPIIMNGEYGITLYTSSYATLPDWVENETYVKVSGTLAIYSNLYEIKSYTAETTNQSDYANHVFPVSIYNITGSESTSDLTVASRKCLISGVVTSVTGTTELTAQMTVNNSSIKVFVKSDNVSKLSDILNDALSSGDEITLKGFTSFHGTEFEVYGYEAVEVNADYTALSFAEDLMSMTELVCTTSSNKEGDLAGIWLTLETEKYSTLSVDQKTILQGANADNSGTTIEQAMARYEFIIAHYHSLNNFIGRSVTLVNTNGNFLFANSTNTTALIVVVAILGLTGIGGIIFIRRRKEN